MLGLDVLRQHENPKPWVVVLDLLRGARALVGERGRHADVNGDQVGPVPVTVAGRS